MFLYIQPIYEVSIYMLLLRSCTFLLLILILTFCQRSFKCSYCWCRNFITKVSMWLQEIHHILQSMTY